MSDHLPECFASLCECDDTHFKSTDCDFSCICPSLRACEQRVLSLNPLALGVLIAQRARERALAAAREAVWESVGPSADAFSLMVLGRALAAIEALREEKK